jgi:hypothetical protein
MVAANGRPGGVTLVAVLTWIQGLLDVVGGIILLFNVDNPAFEREFGYGDAVLIAGIATIVIGVVIIAVARGLLRGSRFARGVVTVFVLLSLISAVYVAIAIPAQLVPAIVSGLLSLIVLGLLWSGKAASFFANS